MKDGTEVMYLGRLNYNDTGNYYDEAFCNPLGKKHIFLRLKKNNEWEGDYIPQSGFTKIAERTSSEALPQFPGEYDKFKKSAYCGDFKDIKLSKASITEKTLDNLNNYGNKLLLKENNQYCLVRINRHNALGAAADFYNRNYKKGCYLYRSEPFEIKLEKGTINLPEISGSEIQISIEELSEKEFYTLSVITEGNKELRIL